MARFIQSVLDNLHVSPRHGNRRSNVDYTRVSPASSAPIAGRTTVLVNEILEHPRGQVTPWIHGNDLFRIAP